MEVTYITITAESFNEKRRCEEKAISIKDRRKERK